MHSLYRLSLEIETRLDIKISKKVNTYTINKLKKHEGCNSGFFHDVFLTKTFINRFDLIF